MGIDKNFDSRVLGVIQSMRRVFVSFWDIDTGWRLIHNNCSSMTPDVVGDLQTDVLKALFDLVLEEDRKTYQVFFNKITFGMKGSDPFYGIVEERVNVSVRLRDGEGYSYHKIECYLEKDEAGEIIRLILMIMPLDAEEIYRLTLAHNITNDRSPIMFIKVANELINRDRSRKYALIQFDVAKFKAINEMYGESFGDELLGYFLESLKVICTQEQLYVRLTADVFMVLTSYDTKEDILLFIKNMNDNLLGYKGVTYRLVFGVAYIEDFDMPLRKFGDRAALARQNSKRNALEYIGFYEEGLKTNVLNSKYVEDHMEKSLANGEFVMYLQPKFSIGKNKIVGAEALVRWFRKGKGMLPPDQFIPIFEENGFITKMDAYIWEQACITLNRWQKKGIKNIPISVNVSRVHFKGGAFITILNNLVEQYQIPKHLLEIEITETAENMEHVVEHMQSLKDNGFTLLMDDFGSGYSSLNTLKDTRFDVVKIDKEFLQDFIESDRGQKIVEHTINMTKAIGLDLVAEGVETKEQAQFLSDWGCDTAQGFYYAKPMSVEEFEKLLVVG